MRYIGSKILLLKWIQKIIAENIKISSGDIFCDIFSGTASVAGFFKNDFKTKSKLILIDPPYGDMMARKKTGESIKQGKSTDATPFTNLKEDLGNMERGTFRKTFKNLVEQSLKYLEDKGHVVVFLKDIQPQNGNTNLWHADVINDLNNIKGLNYLGTKIRADQGVNLYPYGYPYSYVSNQIHQYIMIFKKG